MAKKASFWIIVFAAAVVLSLIAMFLIKYANKNNATAEIWSDGRMLESIDLNEVDEPYKITVEYKDGGTNEILVAPGEISVCNADCPDKLCVKSGAISSGDLPIVCLPHKLIIKLTGGNEYDAVVGGN